jgi:hypothetical protein
MRIKILAIFLLTLLVAGAQPQTEEKRTPPADQSAAATLRGMVASRFVGTWKLVSYTQKTEAGNTMYPFGQYPIGLAMFDSGGHMSVQIMQIPHATFTAGYEHATAEQVKAVYQAYFAYYGTWSVDEMNEQLVEIIKASNQLDYVNRMQTRPYFFDKNQLSLRNLVELNGRQYSIATVWERLP